MKRIQILALALLLAAAPAVGIASTSDAQPAGKATKKSAEKAEKGSEATKKSETAKEKSSDAEAAPVKAGVNTLEDIRAYRGRAVALLESKDEAKADEVGWREDGSSEAEKDSGDEKD